MSEFLPPEGFNDIITITTRPAPNGNKGTCCANMGMAPGSAAAALETATMAGSAINSARRKWQIHLSSISSCQAFEISCVAVANLPPITPSLPPSLHPSLPGTAASLSHCLLIIYLLISDRRCWPTEEQRLGHFFLTSPSSMEENIQRSILLIRQENSASFIETYPLSSTEPVKCVCMKITQPVLLYIKNTLWQKTKAVRRSMWPDKGKLWVFLSRDERYLPPTRQ